MAGAAAGVVLRVEDVGPVAGVSILLAGLASAGLWAWLGPARRGAAAIAVISLAAGLGVGTRAAGAALAPALAALAGDEPALVEGVLRDDAVLTEFGVACTLAADRVERRGLSTPIAGGVRLTIGGADAASRRDAWRAGRRLRVSATLRRPLPYRNFGTADEELRLAWRGIRLFGSVKSAALVEVVAPGSWTDEAAAAARAWTRRTIARALAGDPQAAAIVLAVLIGDRAGLAPDVEARLQRAGTYHVLAISGGNIAVLAALVLASIGRAGFAPRPRALIVVAVLAVYAAVVVAGPSVARATLAAAVYLSARALDLRTPAINAVAVTVAVLMVATPLAVVDVGFWLTTLASLAILLQAEHVAARLRPALPPATPAPLAWIARHAALLAGATIAAEGAVGPVTAFAFGQATVAGLLLNFAAVPLMSVVQCAGFAILAGGAIHPAAAAVPAGVARAAAHGIVESAALVDAAPWTAWTLPPPPLWLAAGAVGAWFAMWLAARPGARRGWVLVWLAAVAGVAAARAPDLPAAAQALRRDRPCPTPPLPADGRWLRVVALDVGQGDATLIRFPDGASWLVDAGGTAAGSRFDVGRRIVAPALRAQGVRALDALLVTHPDLDHAGGAAGVIALMPPALVYEGVPVPGHGLLDGVRRAASTAGSAWDTLSAGARHRRGGVELRVLHPPPADWTRRQPRNDDSVVLELRFGAVSVVLPGDVGPSVEASIARDVAPAPLRVLKAAHHGSRTSSTAAFLDALAPAVVVASAGRGNRHGHPAPAMVERVAARGAVFFRTDRDGAVAIDTDGQRLRVRTCTGPAAELTARAPPSRAQAR